MHLEAQNGWRLGLLFIVFVWVGCGTPTTTPPTNPGAEQPPVTVPGPDTTTTTPPTIPDASTPPEQRTPPPARPDDKPDDPGLLDTNTGTWIGEPCTQDADCNYSGGFCLKEADGYPKGHCSRACTKYCPDRPGKPYTLCIEDNKGGGLCVSRCDLRVHPSTGCRDEYECTKKSRYNQSSLVRSVCTPKPSTPPTGCQSDTDCTSGKKCNRASGACVECLDQADCPSTQQCKGNICQANPPTGCQSDTDCSGKKCETSTGACVECLSNTDCPSGKRCESKVCKDVTPTGCQSDADCASGKTCDKATGQCKTPAPLNSWIGEPCNVDSDCNYTGGVCQKASEGYPKGSCTQACTRTCPDRTGKPTTFCVTDSKGQGRCVSQCDSNAYPGSGCRTSYTCQTKSRHNEASTTRTVCLPPNLPPPRRPPPGTGQGTYVAKMYITYYYLSQESNYSGTANTTLYDKNCQSIVKVPAAFSDSACIEGSGRLKDGRVINYAKTCSCGRPCPTGGIICYSVLDKAKYPWGAGARSNPLRPLRSLAVDRSIIPIGTKLYIPEFDGLQVPSVDGIGGFVHDGCVYADDVGGAIKGNHFDFFSGTKAMYLALNKIHPTRKYLTVYKNPTRCP